MEIKDRIKDFRRVPASELRPNPKNWRTHPTAQHEALKGILNEVGIAGAVIARELEDGTLMLIDGHLRLEELSASEVPVLVLDVNEQEADKLLATYDPISAMAESNSGKLDELIRSIQTNDSALANLLTEIGGYAEEAEPTKLEPVSLAAPAMAWALIGIPVVRWSEINERIESIGAVDGVFCEVRLNDNEDGQKN